MQSASAIETVRVRPVCRATLAIAAGRDRARWCAMGG